MPLRQARIATPALAPIVLMPDLEPGEATRLLKIALQTVRRAYLTVGILLAFMRDEARYAKLGYSDVFAYSLKELRLGRSATYEYLRIYDWVAKNHPEWITPKADTFIPDLNDAAGLIYIEEELERKDLAESTQKALLELKEKGLKGVLRKTDLNPYRRRKNAKSEWRKTYLSALRTLRRRAANCEGMPSEVISHLEAAIEVLQNDLSLHSAGFEIAKPAA